MTMLVEAVEQGSLSAAGRRLRVPLPTLSRKISELEAHLGTTLLLRSTRRLRLTEAGAEYLSACRRILAQVGEAERAAAGEYDAPRGALIMTAPVLFGRLHVLPIVTAFLARYPEIDIRLVLSDRNVHLIDDQVDLAVRIGALPDSSLIATRVGTVRSIVCASPACLTAQGVPDRPQDLAGKACVTHDFTEAAAEWTFPVPPSNAGLSVPIRSRLSVTTAAAAIEAATAGIGFTRLLSYQAAGAVGRGELRIVLAGFEPEPMPVSLVHQGRAALPLKIRSFLDFAAPRLRASLAALEPAARDPAPGRP